MNKVRHIRSLAALWRHRVALYAMGRDVIGGRYRLSIFTVLAFVMAALYLFSPFNIMTDLIPVIGWIDDGFVFYFLLKRLMAELERYEAQKSRLKLISE